MNSKIKITTNDLRSIVKVLTEQIEDGYYKISPEDYLDLLQFTSDQGNAVTKMKRFEGKPLWITGSLNVSNHKSMNSLGNIGFIDGDLDISYTNVGNVDNIQVKGRISDYGSKRMKIREKKILQEKLRAQQDLRYEDAWNPDNTDDVGLKANALLEWLVDNESFNVKTEETVVELENLNNELERLNNLYDDPERDDEVKGQSNLDILNRIEEIEDEISELTEDTIDVYDLSEVSYGYYGLTQFEVLVDGYKDTVFTVGTEDEMDSAIYEYTKNLIDDIGIDGFRAGYIDDYIDEDEVVSVAREYFESWIYDDPSSYFSDDDFVLTDEEEERRSELEDEISDYEDRLLEYDEDSEEYSQIQEHIEQLQEELDEIEPITEPTQEMIDEKVDEMVKDVQRDVMSFIEDYGLNIKDYVDVEKLIKGVVDDDGYGSMNGYNGNYDDIVFNGTTYYIMRVE